MQRIVILVLVLAFVVVAEIDHAREIAREHEGFIAVCETADRAGRCPGCARRVHSPVRRPAR